VSRLLARYRQLDLDAQAATKVRAAVEAGEDDPGPNPRARANDPNRLRGIPVVGVKGGRGGAIPGSQPGAALLRRHR
jgi:hypothetical protein